MRVAIDASCLAVSPASGVRSYTFNLLRSLLRLQQPQDEYVCWLNFFCRTAEIPDLAGVRTRALRFPRRILEWLWRRMGFPPVDWLTGPIDVFHSVHLHVPPQQRGASVLTVHDCRDFRFPDLFPRLQDFREYRAAMARRADRVIAVSESTRQDAIDFLGVRPEKVRVIHNGLDPRYQKVLSDADIGPELARLGIDRPFVLYVSSADPRKAPGDAVEAFARAEAKDHLLVLAGLGGHELRRALQRPGVGGLRAVGMVSDHQLHCLMAGARALLFPSLHEGFGLPILEALACGTPVVAYDNSAIPEVAGEAGILVPSGDVAALAEAVTMVLCDESVRARLVGAAPKQASRFSWDASAAAVREVYSEAFQAAGAR